MQSQALDRVIFFLERHIGSVVIVAISEGS